MKNQDAVLLSLGHNSSAIYTNGTANIGYEEERLNREKSSSRPPLRSLREIQKHVGIPRGTPIFVTHWFDSFSKSLLPEAKYTLGIPGFADAMGSKIITHSHDFTHHDAHAWSAYSFWQYYIKSARSNLLGETLHFIVADGFGNHQEVISVYKIDKTTQLKGPQLIHRYYGYKNSLGLMYQYATNFVGMKMHQDEYKFLGYESHIYEYRPDLENINTALLEARISTEVHNFITRLEQDSKDLDDYSSYSLINYSSLNFTQTYWEVVFQDILNICEIDNRYTEEARIVIGYVVQSIIQRVMYYIVNKYDMDNVCLSGGIFYNVKLNNSILNNVLGHVSVVPLAGDQGAAIGFYQKFVGDFNWSTLAIGERGFYKSDVKSLANNDLGIYVPDSREEALELLQTKISAGEICNFVTSKMEYGPRALGHTSSLFLPSKENAKLNNQLNRRNEVMPFAPMILESCLGYYFNKEQYSRVVGSDRFMIITYDYVTEPADILSYYPAVAHPYPSDNLFSGRPQVISEQSYPFMHELMKRLLIDNNSLLTNTSYNYHGEPIVFRIMEMLATHNKQLINGKPHGAKVNLIIYNSKD